jgi:hypothetical protein
MAAIAARRQTVLIEQIAFFRLGTTDCAFGSNPAGWIPVLASLRRSRGVTVKVLSP